MANVTSRTSAGILGIVALLWGASGMAGERAVVTTTTPEAAATMGALEGAAARHRDDSDAHQGVAVAELAQAYLDAHAPGLAIRVVESASPSVRSAAPVEHLYAVALFDEGRAHEAQVAEQDVLTKCESLGHAERVDACDARLVASASRRLEYLNQMIALGVEDPAAHPEASQIAYRGSTREARMAVASR